MLWSRLDARNNFGPCAVDGGLFNDPRRNVQRGRLEGEVEDGEIPARSETSPLALMQERVCWGSIFRFQLRLSISTGIRGQLCFLLAALDGFWTHSSSSSHKDRSW